MGAASPATLSQSLDRFAALQPRSWMQDFTAGTLADDRADHVAAADRTHADGGQSSGTLSWSYRRRHCKTFSTAPLLIFWQAWMLATVRLLSVMTNARNRLAGHLAGAHLLLKSAVQ